MRDWQANHLELLEHDASGEWVQVRCAVNNTLAIPFQIHKQDVQKYKVEDDYLDMISRQAVSLVQTYGDAREQRIEAMEA